MIVLAQVTQHFGDLVTRTPVEQTEGAQTFLAQAQKARPGVVLRAHPVQETLLFQAGLDPAQVTRIQAQL